MFQPFMNIVHIDFDDFFALFDLYNRAILGCGVFSEFIRIFLMHSQLRFLYIDICEIGSEATLLLLPD
jgi:hypothetical protein